MDAIVIKTETEIRQNLGTQDDLCRNLALPSNSPALLFLEDSCCWEGAQRQSS